MKTSPSGRALIERREGRRLTAYRDSRGIWTIGVGHAATGLPPRPCAGMTITEEECDALLAADLAPVEAVINAAVKVPISQNEFDALASLGFNIGVAGLRRSSVIRKLNLGDVEGAADAFMAWSKPAVLAGRRREERAQFREPDPPNDTGISRSHTVAVARSAALHARAQQTTANAKTTAAGGAVFSVATAAAAAAAVDGGQHHVASILFGLVIAGAAIDAVFALTQRRSAATLSINASAQAATAASLVTPANPVIPVKA